MDITDEMEEPAERHGAIPRRRTADNIEIHLVGLQDVFWRRLDRLHTRRLPRGFAQFIAVCSGLKTQS
jgi:hypothetical protein